MKKAFLLLFFLPLSVFSIAQTNLVPNPSFEDHTNCPSMDDQIHFASPWFEPCNSTPDFFHACGTNGFSVPLTGTVNQDARTGDGFAGAFFYMGSNAREYIETPLLTPLEEGKKYCAEYYVNLTDISMYAIDGFGMYFSIDSLTDTLPYYFQVTPQVENPSGNTISEKNGWVKISGTFFAQGGESFLTIGNFRSDANTNIDTLSTGFSSNIYYFIEDVSVYLCDSLSSVPEITVPTLLNTGSQLYITGMKGGNYRLSLYDVRGRRVYHSEDYRNEFYCYGCRDALYLYELTTPEGERFTGKIVIMREP